MPKIANLSADLVANTTKFEADLKRADRTLAQSQRQWTAALTAIDKQFGALGGSVGKLTGGLFSLKGAFLPLLGISGAAGLVALTKNSLDAVGGLGELSSQLGVSTDDLQSFRYAASQVGLSSAEMETAIARLTRTIGDAASGEKQAVDSFNRLGVGVLDAAGNVRSTSDIIRDAADALQGIDDPARRASIAVDLFGKAGQRMLPFLEGGARGIDALVSEAKSLGLVFDQDVIAQADSASDKLATLGFVLDHQVKAILVELAPIITRVADQLLKIAKAINLDGTGLSDINGLDQAIAKYERLSDQYDGLLESYNRQVQLSKDLGIEDGVDVVTNSILDRLTKKAGELERTRLIIDQLMLNLDNADAGIGTDNGGTGNPPAGGTGDSQAAKEAEAVARRIADLRFELEQLGRGETAQKLAIALRNIRPTPEQMGEIESLVTQIEAVGDAAATQQQEFDALVDGLINQGEKRRAEIARIFEETRTPAEEYAAEVAYLNELLGGSAANQDLLNRALAQARTEFEAAAPAMTGFQDMAREASGVLFAGLTDAAFAADNLEDALAGVLRQMAKLAANKALGALLDFGLGALFGGFSGSVGNLLAAPFPGMSAKATGGPGAGLTLVGERGPEIVDLPNGSYVVPSMRSTAMMQQVPMSNIGGPAAVVINAPITVNGNGGTREQNADLASQMAREFDRTARAIIREEIADQQRIGGQLNQALGF